jgi:hypothetical protein
MPKLRIEALAMTTQSLLSIFPNHQDLLALTPEDLAGVIVEMMPPLLQNGLFNPANLTYPLYAGGAQSNYPPNAQRAVELAIAESMSWLVTQGLLIVDPGQPSHAFYVPTRRAQSLRTRADVEAFRKGRILPDDPLPAVFAEKVVPLFRRGDHDVAVFQGFKEVEVAVRKAANAKGAGYSDSDLGVPLMRKAFHPETGPLTARGLVYPRFDGIVAPPRGA